MGKGKQKGVIKSSDKKIDGKVLPKSEVKVLEKLEGEPIPPHIRTALEAELGADFSDVRIHTDSHAFRAASAIGAQAFTMGRDVFFNGGQYNPNTAEGKHLLSHELTHVVQQGGQGKVLIQR